MQHKRSWMFVAYSTAAIVAAIATVGASSGRSADERSGGDQDRHADRGYVVHNLVSDGFVPADHVDADLVNPWGLVFNPNAVAWVADNGTGLSTLYDGGGNKNPLVVRIPSPAGGVPPSKPTGIVFSGGNDFVVTVGSVSAPARFIFAAEDGTISAWAPQADPTNAILEVDNAPAKAIYKGLALAANGAGHFLYATDFHNNRIDVFDAHFHAVSAPGGFRDPVLPRHYAPFGIQNILGNLYVTYARQDEDAEDDVAGRGFGFVDVFDANGQLVERFASRGALNAPWGLALAPADFGRFSNMLLVGNFGDGRINVFDLSTGGFRGQLRGSGGGVLTIDGLWALAFGNGLLNQPTSALFFTAGPDDESHGVYGRIDARAEPGRGSH